MVARGPTPSVSPTKPDVRHTGRETTVDKRDKRQMLDKLIELKARCGCLDDEDTTVALPLGQVQIFVEDRWAAAVAADAQAAEAAAAFVDEHAPGR